MAGEESKQPLAKDFDPRVFKLFDSYTHGFIDRRDFLEGVSRFAVGGLTAAAILDAFFTPSAFAQQIAEDDKRIKGEYVDYPSPKGRQGMRGYLARPANGSAKLPGIVVVHGAAGPEKHFEDVARRLALANFVGFMVDSLAPAGGWAVSQSGPDHREKGNAMMAQVDPAVLIEDYIAAVRFLKGHPLTTGKVGVIGFCWGGGTTNTLAVRVPELDAAVSFYGGQPGAADVQKIKAPIMLHYGALDTRLTAGWPAFETALKAGDKTYAGYVYDGAQHAFNNDADGARYNKAAADLAWQRSIEFFNKYLR